MNPATFSSHLARIAMLTANTPLFLADLLTKDPSVILLAQTEPNLLFAALTASVQNPSTNLDERVRPYALLVALWIRKSEHFLKQAIELPHGEAIWLKLMAKALLKNLTPTYRLNIPPIQRFESKPRTNLLLTDSAGNSFRSLEVEN